MRYTWHLVDFKAFSLLQCGYKKFVKDSVNTFNAFLLTTAGLLFNPFIYSFNDINKNIKVLKEAAEYIYIVYCPNVIPIPLLIYIIINI